MKRTSLTSNSAIFTESAESKFDSKTHIESVKPISEMHFVLWDSRVKRKCDFTENVNPDYVKNAKSDFVKSVKLNSEAYVENVKPDSAIPAENVKLNSAIHAESVKSDSATPAILKRRILFNMIHKCQLEVCDPDHLNRAWESSDLSLIER